MIDVFRHPVVLGAGPVGRAVVGRLAESGSRATVITRSGTVVPGADTVAADVSDPAAARKAVAGASVVFQCAQPAYRRWVQEFRSMQDSILAACEDAGAPLIATENVYGYGDVDGPMSEATPLIEPSDAFRTRKGLIRADAWRDLAAAHQAGRVATAAVRASDFFGPRVTTSMFGERFFGPLVAGRKAQLFGPADRRHTITYVPDLAAALVAVAADPERWGRAWHAPNAAIDGGAPTVAQIMSIAAEAAGTAPRSTVVTRWMLRLAGLFNPDTRELIEMLYEFERDFIVDSSTSEAALGLSATPLAESVASTVAWYREHNHRP